MTRTEIERMRQYTDKHVRDPQPGDHFTEMLGSVAYIEARLGNMVTLKKMNCARGHKGWGRSEIMPVSEFVRWASYGGTIPGYWLELFPPRFPKELLEGG